MNEIVFIHNKLRESVLSSNIRKMVSPFRLDFGAIVLFWWP